MAKSEKKQFKCEECGKHFSSKKLYNQHMKKGHKEEKKAPCCTLPSWVKGVAIGVGIVAVLAVLIVFAVRRPSPSPSSPPNVVTTTPAQTTNTQSGKGSVLTVLSDKRCPDCDPAPIIQSLKQIFPNIQVKELDYSSPEGKSLYNELSTKGVKFLPAFLFSEGIQNDSNFNKISPYLRPAGNYMNLNVGADFDPTAEICDNGKDDTGNGLVDCADPSCASAFFCNKRAKPLVELFVMSHCPYGTQTEKGMLPVVKLLGDKIDFKLRFVGYAMHGEVEVKEQLLQHCIQKEEPSKLIPYLECFLEDGKTDRCLPIAKIDTAKIEACKKSVDAQFEITKNLEDKTLWLNGRFPVFAIDAKLAEKYNIQGSPGLAINGYPIDRFNRDPASLLKLICQGFAVLPAECSTQLSSATPTPGFGFNTQEGASQASCG